MPPVKPRHHQHVARLERGHRLAQLGPISLGAARHFPEHLAGPSRPQGSDLRRHALAVRRYPLIPDFTPDF
jgi:hypothetical protein